MGFLIGTDEAGYGPNLGPLVISATVWSVPDDALGADLYRVLRKAVSSRPPAAARHHQGRVVLADSKALYNPALGLGLLERGLLAVLATLDHRPCRWQQMWELLCPEAASEFTSAPWFLDYDDGLPLVAKVKDLERAAARMRDCCEQAGVRLVSVRCRAVFPEELNRLMAKHGTKGAALSHLTLALLGSVLGALPDGPVAVTCDKHGGRNTYGSLLQPYTDDWLVEVYRESRQASVYRFGPEHRRVEVCFRPRAEQFLPTALASMTSKYMRELAMRPFNRFWCNQLPELRPTAGYPRDARRFKTAIEPLQQELGIADHVLWRER
jgi:hypothetical protein